MNEEQTRDVINQNNITMKSLVQEEETELIDFGYRKLYRCTAFTWKDGERRKCENLQPKNDIGCCNLCYSIGSLVLVEKNDNYTITSNTTQEG